MSIDYIRVIETLIRSIVGGLFTILGVFITIGYYRKKDLLENADHIFERRPNLVIAEDDNCEPQ